MPWRFLVALSVLIAAALSWFLLDDPRPQDGRPVSLPATFAGVPRTQDADFSTSDWPVHMREQIGAAPFAGGTFNAPKLGRNYARPFVNVIAARTDLTGVMDLRMAADAGRAYGAVRCTSNLVAPGTHDSMHGRLMLCWRTSPRLSVSALVVLGPADPAVIAGGLDDLWAQLA